MQTITDNKAVVEQNLGAMQKLTAGVAQLDAGGSTLYKGHRYSVRRCEPAVQQHK